MVKNFNIIIKELNKNDFNNDNLEQFYNELNKELDEKYSILTNTDTDTSSINSLNELEEICSDIANILFEEYNVLTNKELNHIIKYYNLKKQKNKQDTIWKIIDYETNMNNINITEKRRELWKYINEIKKDKYLSKFITI